MDISKIGIGEAPPHDVNVLIEIPQGGVPVKYELDKASGALRVDRFLHTAMFYPGNYGFTPHTLSGDGDPVDVIVVGPGPYKDLPKTLCEQIVHFFQHYKDLEKGKWVTRARWLETAGAEKMIVDGIRRRRAPPGAVSARRYRRYEHDEHHAG